MKILHVLSQRPEATGSRAEKAECLALAAQLGEERVTVHGPMLQAELADLFKQAHIFVLSSLFEGLPLVLLEALACGCRLVATDLPGVREVLGGVAAEWLERVEPVSYTHLTLPTIILPCRSRWSPDH